MRWPSMATCARNVVLVEDCDDARVSLQKILEQQGHTVHTAIDGQSGKAEAWPPTRKGLGYDESRIRHSDGIFFTPDGKVVRHVLP